MDSSSEEIIPKKMQQRKSSSSSSDEDENPFRKGIIPKKTQQRKSSSSDDEETSSSEEKIIIKPNKQEKSVPGKLSEYSDATKNNRNEAVNLHVGKDVTSIISSFFSSFQGETKEIKTENLYELVKLDSDRSLVHFIQKVLDDRYFVTLNIETGDESKMLLDHEKLQYIYSKFSLYDNLLFVFRLDGIKPKCLIFDIKKKLYITEIGIDFGREGAKLITFFRGSGKIDVVSISDGNIIILFRKIGYKINHVASVDMNNETTNFVKKVNGEYIGLTHDKKLIFVHEGVFIVVH